jgi:hypothetical protein
VAHHANPRDMITAAHSAQGQVEKTSNHRKHLFASVLKTWLRYLFLFQNQTGSPPAHPNHPLSYPYINGEDNA